LGFNIPWNTTCKICLCKKCRHLLYLPVINFLILHQSHIISYHITYHRHLPLYLYLYLYLPYLTSHFTSCLIHFFQTSIVAIIIIPFYSCFIQKSVQFFIFSCPLFGSCCFSHCFFIVFSLFSHVSCSVSLQVSKFFALSLVYVLFSSLLPFLFIYFYYTVRFRPLGVCLSAYACKSCDF